MPGRFSGVRYRAKGGESFRIAYRFLPSLRMAPTTHEKSTTNIKKPNASITLRSS